MMMMTEGVAKFKGDEARIAFCRGRDIAREGHNWGAQPAFSLEIRGASAWKEGRRLRPRQRDEQASIIEFRFLGSSFCLTISMVLYFVFEQFMKCGDKVDEIFPPQGMEGKFHLLYPRTS